MKKVIPLLCIAIFGIAIVVSLFIIFFPINEPTYYTVEFDTSGGTNIEKQIVKQNEYVQRPKNPTKPDYVFVEWDYNGQEYNFNTPVTNNMTINAVWRKSDASIVYKVELVLEDQIQTLQIPEGGTINIELLEFEDKNGYIIEWYLNDEKINLGDIVITDNCTIIGKYEKEKTYTVSFDTDGGTKVEKQEVKENEKVKEPKSPTKTGYTFDGWFLNDKKYNFGDKVTKDLIIKAHWKKESPKEVEKVLFSRYEESLEVASTKTLTPNIEPKDATNVNLTWKSNNPNIASVDENGKVTAKAIGETIIQAQTKNGLSAKITIKVISSDRIHFLKLGTNGNAILLESNGKFAMIDAGGSPTIGIDSCNENIFKYLNSMDIKELEFVIISHFHWDHAYCLSGQDEPSPNGFLLKHGNIKVKKIIIKDYNLANGIHSARVKNYYSRITSAMSSSDIIKAKNEGATFSLNNFNISLYNTPERFSSASPEDNDNANSLVAVVEYNKNNKSLLTYIPGDIQNTANTGNNLEAKTAQRLATKYNRVFDLYVASHHGYSSNNPNSAIGNRSDRIQFKNAIITNTFDNFCTIMNTQASAANALSRIYVNMQRNTGLGANYLYFSGRKNVIAHYTNNGLYITGGDTLTCTSESCKDGAETAKNLKQYCH